MNQLIFDIGNTLILPFWLALIVAPGWVGTRRLLATPLISAVLAVLYSVLVIPHAAELLPLLARPQLDVIAQLLGTPLGAAAAWLHFLAFDLFVARWIWSDALQRGLSLLLLRPILLTTLMFGPLGLLVYLCARRWPTAKAPRPLVALAAVMTGLVFLCWVGLAVDRRIITGLPAWIKPLKFALSVIIYSLTMEAILQAIQDAASAQRIRKITTFCLSLEMAVVVFQTLRGTTSHFNADTPLDACLFALMGLAIVPVWLAAMHATWLICRHTIWQPGLQEAIRWGMLIAVVGMGVAWPMTARGGHTIGEADGGPGLPILGWSTTSGDLRVAHFVGMHAMQLLPLAWLLLRRHFSAPRLTGVIHTIGFGYLTFVGLLTHQALQGVTAFSLGLPVVWLGLAVISLVAAARTKPSPS